ncbi:MAG: hypothetical protein MSQ05_08985 [Akkermansia sp.]|nr:hypothetical protein [Akkermansia sp.]
MIPIRNIYYMLAYAFDELGRPDYHRCRTEPFTHAVDLLSAILVCGITAQLKRGCARDYRPEVERLPGVRGRILAEETIRTRAILYREFVCEHDFFDENCYPNQVLKTAMLRLMAPDLCSEVPDERRLELRRLLGYFSRVDELSYRHIDWKRLITCRHSGYTLLMNICEMICKDLLLTEEDGSVFMRHLFTEEKEKCHLYEKFIRNYFKREHPMLRSSAKNIPWALQGIPDALLPTMKADVVLHFGGRTLIIDAKYYGKNTSEQHNTRKLHSANLYQIYTYVDNYRKTHPGEQVNGMLLYAMTEEVIQPDAQIDLVDVPLSSRSLDLSRDFCIIEQQLDAIAHSLTDDK